MKKTLKNDYPFCVSASQHIVKALLKVGERIGSGDHFIKQELTIGRRVD